MSPSQLHIAQNDQDLRSAVAQFMGARSYDAQWIGADALLGRRQDGHVAGAVVLADDVSDGMAAAHTGIEQLRAAGVQTQQIPVVKRSLKGITTVSEIGGLAQTPMYYFDWYFRDRSYDAEDQSGALRRSLKTQLEKFKPEPRASQRFRRLRSLDAEGSAAPAASGDLRDALWPSFGAYADAPRLIVLCGPAGMGKSLLTAKLLKAAHANFNVAKGGGGLATRPILFEPSQLGSGAKGDDIASFRDLIARMFDTDITKRVPTEAMKWLHHLGLNSWIFDGLDEFFRSQEGFFETLNSALDAPGGRGRILISTRDSLMSSSDNLRGFLEHRLETAPEQTEIYELLRWDAEGRRGYVEVVLTEELGREPTAAEIDGVAAQIEQEPALADLAALPFYCSELVKALRAKRGATFADEFALLQFAVDRIIDREIVEKKVMRLSDFVSEWDREEIAAEHASEDETQLAARIDARGKAELEDMLGLVAYLSRFAEETPQAEIDAEEWAETVLPTLIAPELGEEAAQRLELALAHFPLFARSDQEGEVQFAHPLIADHLAATHALNLARSNPASPQLWSFAVGRRTDWEGTVYFWRIAATLRGDSELRRAAEEAVESGAMGAAEIRLRRLLEAVKR